jgi:hypothetical protein
LHLESTDFEPDLEDWEYFFVAFFCPSNYSPKSFRIYQSIGYSLYNIQKWSVRLSSATFQALKHIQQVWLFHVVQMHGLHFLIYFPNFFFFLIVMCAPSSVFCVLFVCKCVLYCCQRVSTKLQLNNNNMTCQETIVNIMGVLINCRQYLFVLALCNHKLYKYSVLQQNNISKYL